MRRGIAALALLAALSVLLQPVCAAVEFQPAAPHSPATLADNAAHGTDDRVPCCLEVEPGALAAPSSTGPAKAILAAGLSAPMAYAAAPGAALYSHARPGPGIPPPPLPLPYHVRSARIQR